MERKLNVIEDAYHNHNYERVVKLCDKKDIANHCLVKVFKAWALDRMDSCNAAAELVREVLKSGEGMGDRFQVDLMVNTMRNCGCDHEIVLIYEAYLKLNPNDQNYAERHFQSLYRESRFKEMQMSAMQMAKRFKSAKPHLAWGGTLMILNSLRLYQEDITSEEAKKQLTFGEVMLRKSLKELRQNTPVKPNTEENICMLILESLVLQDKMAEALEFCDKELLPRLQTRDGLLLMAELRIRTNNSDDLSVASQLFYQLLKEEDGEDWRNWCGYLETSMDAAAPETILADIESLRSPGSGQEVRRAPSLALVMFHYRRMLLGHEEGMFVQSLNLYIQSFGWHSCCFGDIRNVLLAVVEGSSSSPALRKTKPPNSRPILLKKRLGKSFCEEILETKQSRSWPVEDYASLVTKASRDAVISFVENLLQESMDKVAATTFDEGVKQCVATKKLIRTVITCHQVLTFVGAYDLEEELMLSLISTLTELYTKTCVLDTETVTEVKTGDDIVLLCSHLLISLANKTNKTKYLHAAAAFLESGYAHSPNGFQLVMGLMEVYGRLDAVCRVHELYEKLDIKHIQLDSLSYLCLGPAIHSGLFNIAGQICDSIEGSWKTWRAQNPRFVREALDEGNLCKALEVDSLDRRLQLSHQHAVCTTEKFMLELAGLCNPEKWGDVPSFVRVHYEERGPRFDFSTLGDLRKLDLEKLASNYDFAVRMTWDCPNGGKTALEKLKGEFMSPAVVPDRASLGSLEYDKVWRRRAALWMRFRLNIGEVVYWIVEKTGEDEERKASLLGQFRELSKELGFDQENPALNALVHLFEANLSTGSNESAANSLKAASELTFTIPATLSSLASELVNVYSLIVFNLRWLMDKHPKKRNKKKKQPPGLEELQKALKQMVTSTVEHLQNVNQREYVKQEDEDKAKEELFLPVDLKVVEAKVLESRRTISAGIGARIENYLALLSQK